MGLGARLRLASMGSCEAIPGAETGFWERGGLINIFTTGGEGTGGGVPSPVTARGYGGTLIAPSVGFGAKPQSLFCFAFI